MIVVITRVGDLENYVIEFQPWEEFVAAHGAMGMETRARAVVERHRIQIAMGLVGRDGKTAYMLDSIPEVEDSLEGKQAALMNDPEQTTFYLLHAENCLRHMRNAGLISGFEGRGLSRRGQRILRKAWAAGWTPDAEVTWSIIIIDEGCQADHTGLAALRTYFDVINNERTIAR